MELLTRTEWRDRTTPWAVRARRAVAGVATAALVAALAALVLLSSPTVPG